MDLGLQETPASPTGIHPSDWSQAPRITKILAASVVVLAALCVYLMYLAGTAYEIQGPMRIAANESNAILIGTYRNLYLLDEKRHVAKFSPTDLGLVGPITSITPDGDQWLVGDDDTGLLYRCTAALKNCTPLVANLKGERMFSRAHGVALIGGQIVVSDSERHRLRIFDPNQGLVTTTRTSPVQLCYPNDVMAFEGSLYVTDTNNFRVAQIHPQEDFRSETFIQTAAGEPFISANCADISSRVAKRGDAYGNLILDTTVSVGRSSLPPARQSRILPVSILRTTRGEWWVVQMKGNMQAGDVIIYANGQPIKRVALPEDSDPVDMHETRDGVLIVDPTLSRIYAVDLDGTVRDDWGPIELTTELKKILVTRARWQLFKPASWAVLGLALLLGVFVIAREYLRTKGNLSANKVFKLEPTDSPPAPLSAPEDWISVNEKFAKQVQWTSLIAIAMAIALFAIEGYLLFTMVNGVVGSAAARNNRVILAFGAMVTVVGAAIIFSAVSLRRQVHMRIGTDGRNLLFDPGNNNVEYCDLADVLVCGRTLLVGKRLVTSYSPYGPPVYPIERLRSTIVARIPHHNFVRWPRFVHATLKRGNLPSWMILIGGVLFTAMRVIPSLLK